MLMFSLPACPRKVYQARTSAVDMQGRRPAASHVRSLATKASAGPENAGGGAVVALGKFDAMHLGHASLAIRAADLGRQPYLLSFSGMAQVLGWPARQPLVAPCDRSRVLRSWTELCHGRTPRQRYVPFDQIRHMMPEEFVRLLAHDLRASGVVAGTNYRFGYKASGTAETLVDLGQRYGLNVSIVDLLPSESPGDVGQVSSSKVREMLSVGRVDKVARYLGRPYRLVLELPDTHAMVRSNSQHTLLPLQHALNQLPGAASYFAHVHMSHPEQDLHEKCLQQLGSNCQVQVVADGVLLPVEISAKLQQADLPCLVTIDFLNCKVLQ